jgi:hypothetical protein
MRSCKHLAALMALLPGLIGGSAAADEPLTPLTRELAGTALTYRFPIGRVYRATYGAEQVRFELIEPVLAEAPSATLPYVARRIRDEVYLVAWHGDPKFHSTQLIDLEKRELHASALLEGERGFFETARIVEIVRTP